MQILTNKILKQNKSHFMAHIEVCIKTKWSVVMLGRPLWPFRKPIFHLSTCLWQCCETKTNDLFFWSWWGILGIISLCSDHLLLYFRICQNRMYFARVLRPFQRVSVTGSGWFMHQHCNRTPTSRVVSARVPSCCIQRVQE